MIASDEDQDTDSGFCSRSGAALSAAIQSDLVRWHEQMTALGDSRISLHPAQFRVLVARCVQAVAEARKSAREVIEAAADIVENERADIAAGCLRAMVDAFRDTAPEGRVN